MKASVIAIDLAKNVFQICALDEQRQVILNKKVKRSELLHELRQFEPTLVVMEACYSSNPWGRRIQQLGHTAQCVPAFTVKPFVIGNKTDANDALAIAEAAIRPNVRHIAIKSVEQQDVQSLYKIRELMMRQRTAVANQLRGLLAEYGEILPKGLVPLRKIVPEILENGENELSFTARKCLQRLYNNVQNLTEQIEAVGLEALQLIEHQASYQRVMTVPGVGKVSACAFHAFVNDIHAFKNGRQFAAWIGLTPKLAASGDNTRLGTITKRGNRTLRRLLIQGSRILLNYCGKSDTPLNCWVQQLKARMHSCKCAVALANKLARIIWHVLARDEVFDPKKACA